MRSSSHWKFWIVLFPIIGTCALANFPGGMKGFFAAWYGQAFFDPRGINGLEWWIDASDLTSITIESGTNRVQQWNDKSGNEKHLYQNTGGSRPFSISGAQNGKSVVRFTGSQSLTVSNSTSKFNFLHQSNTTLFVVFNISTNANGSDGTVWDNSQLAAHTGGGIGAFFYYYDYAGGVDAAWFQHGSGVQSISNNVIVYADYQLATLVVNPTNSIATNRIEVSFDNKTGYRNNPSSGAISSLFASYNFTIGAQSVGTSFGMEGDLCEILFYSGNLSASDISRVRNYLNAKWSIY